MNPQGDQYGPPGDQSPRISLAELLFYSLLLVLPFEDLLAVGGASIPKLVGLAFILFSFAQWRIFWKKMPRELVVLLGFVGIGFVMDLVQNPNLGALNEFSRPLFLWGLLLAGYNLAINDRFERVIGVVYAAAILLTIFQVLNLGGNIKIYSEVVGGEDGDRVSVLGSDPNFLAIFLSVGVLYSLARFLNWTGTMRAGRRILFLLGAGLGFYAILKTGSRGGLLALGGGLLSLILTGRDSGRMVKSGAVIVCVFVLMGMVVVNNSFIMARFQENPDQSDYISGFSLLQNASTSGRLQIWEQAAQLITESPVHGYGATMHAEALGQRVMSRTVFKFAHNLFLSILLGTGVSGFLCFLYFYVRTFKSIWACRMEAYGSIVFAWFILFFVGGLSLSLQVSKLFWIVMALSLAAREVYAVRRAQAEAWELP